ncbi:MAG TPA: MmgE/PrpD family protein [Solirubrobacteraceae bacterium]|jgi:2-methylcitrate dehydratase PrpD
MSGLTLALAERAGAISYDAVPDDVREIARQALLDWFAVTLAGSREDGPAKLLEVLSAGDGGTEADAAAAADVTVVGHGVRLPPLRAALVNGTASHQLDFDDVNIVYVAHVTVAVLGAALALAEQLDRDAGALIEAFVAGYETTCRVAAALGPEPYLRGFHSTGTLGTFGAATACARLLGLDAPTTARALGIAASEAAGLKCNFGTMTKPLHAGRACENGLLAALLAARGFSASPDAIEAAQGFAEISGADLDADAALAPAPEGWHLRANLFKHHASCFFTHSAIEGVRELGVRADEIARVSIHVSELELGTCVVPAPRTGLEAKFSIAHLAAMAILDRDTRTIDDHAARDEQTSALRAKIVLVSDGRPGAPTRVDVELIDGSVRSASHDVNRPERDLAVQRGRLSDKFTALAVPVLGSARADDLLSTLAQLDRERPVRELTRLAVPER